MCVFSFLYFCFSSVEHRFLIAGLVVEKKPSWEERQATYLAVVKAFLTKLKPEFASLPVTFVKGIRFEPKLMLSVDCAKPKQYVIIVIVIFTCHCLLATCGLRPS
jgi:hypothetical protein